MKKSLYIICLCCLSVLVYHEVKVNMIDDTSSRYIPTARLLSSVKSENTKEKNTKGKNKKVVYLTFDDGPSEVTNIVLDTLKEKNVNATFFLVGSEITKEREDIVKRAVAEGNALGVHAYDHSANHLYCNKKSFLKDFDLCQKRIQEVTGKKVKIHRYPWGSNNAYLKGIFKKVQKELKAKEIRSFDWNCSGEDALNHVTEQSIAKNVRKDIGNHKKTIVLLHDYNGTKRTAHVLGSLIDYMKKKGYRFDTLENVPEMLFKDCYK